MHLLAAGLGALHVDRRTKTQIPEIATVFLQLFIANVPLKDIIL
jgi:hypothetical protein